SSWAARMAAIVPRASGPTLPACRYAYRSRTGNCARASSNVTRGILPTPCLTFPPDACGHLGSAGIHAAVRPRVVGRARRSGSGGGARHLALPVRNGLAARRILGARMVLSPVVAYAGEPPASRGQGGRASARYGAVRDLEARRAPRPVAR